MNSTPPDPIQFVRALFDEWRRAGGAPGSGGAPDGLNAVLSRALGGANIPGRSDLEELSQRLGRIEAALFRLEGKVDALTGQRPPAPPEPAEG